MPIIIIQPSSGVLCKLLHFLLHAEMHMKCPTTKVTHSRDCACVLLAWPVKEEEHRNHLMQQHLFIFCSVAHPHCMNAKHPCPQMIVRELNPNRLFQAQTLRQAAFSSCHQQQSVAKTYLGDIGTRSWV